MNCDEDDRHDRKKGSWKITILRKDEAEEHMKEEEQKQERMMARQ